jgi:hypothetical protein
LLLEAAVERRRASGAVAAEAWWREEMRKWWRGTVMAGARAWRRSSDAMGLGWEAARRRWDWEACQLRVAQVEKMAHEH